MSDSIKIVFGLLGGLAIFIYGMNLMGEGLQKAAGDKMRRVINILTGNPVVAVMVGALVTALMQSSSATTVMVVSFVSARLMTLPQAIAVIMGANIGTTITAQLIAFNVGHYAYFIAAVGFILFFFFKKKTVRYIGQTIFAFGLLFVGLNTMGSVMKPLAQDVIFKDMMLALKDIPVLGVLAGAVMTMIVQSSSATIGVLQELASQPLSPGSSDALISVSTAIPILFGCNIGTTITAILASIGTKINAKRAALAHSIFNILGAVVFVWFIPIFAKTVQFISPRGPEVDIIKRQIANAHSVFNILNTLLWLPFIWVLTRIVRVIIRGEDIGVEKRTLYLDSKMIRNASIAMDLATKELTRMALLARQMMSGARKAFLDEDMKEAENVFEIEETVDLLQDEIIHYLSMMLSQGTLTEHQSVRLAGLMHVTSDIERIGDHCENISEFATYKKDEKIPLSCEALQEITDAFGQLDEIVGDSINALKEGNVTLAQKVISKEQEIDELEENLRTRHIARLNASTCNPRSAITFTELIHNLERIADHCKNIAEAVVENNRSHSS